MRGSSLWINNKTLNRKKTSYNLQVSVLYLTTLLTYSKQACYFSFNAFKQQTDLRLHGENKATKKHSPNSLLVTSFYHIQGDERAKAK